MKEIDVVKDGAAPVNITINPLVSLHLRTVQGIERWRWRFASIPRRLKHALRL